MRQLIAVSHHPWSEDGLNSSLVERQVSSVTIAAIYEASFKWRFFCTQSSFLEEMGVVPGVDLSLSVMKDFFF